MLSELAALLRQQLAVQNSLLLLEQEKTGTLLKGEAERLGDMMNAEQALMMNATNLQNRIFQLQSDAGCGDVSLRHIVEQYAPNDEEGLATLFRELSEVVANLKKTTNLNTKLLHTRLSTMRYMSHVLGLDEAEGPYHKR